MKSAVFPRTRPGIPARSSPFLRPRQAARAFRALDAHHHHHHHQQQQQASKSDSRLPTTATRTGSGIMIMSRAVLVAIAIVASAKRAEAQAPETPELDPTVTAHCTWDADCATPILHGAADNCHRDQAVCEGRCSSDEEPVRTPTWCEGEPYPEPTLPGGVDPSAPGCTWHDAHDLRLLPTCAAAGSRPQQMACRQHLAQDLHPTCQSCLQANDHNVTACLLDSSPHCLVHDAHDVSSRSRLCPVLASPHDSADPRAACVCHTLPLT
jgi:hypothetical protein